MHNLAANLPCAVPFRVGVVCEWKSEMEASLAFSICGSPSVTHAFPFSTDKLPVASAIQSSSAL